MSVKLANSLEKEFGMPYFVRLTSSSGPTINQLMEKHLGELIAGLGKDLTSGTTTVAKPVPLVEDETSPVAV